MNSVRFAQKKKLNAFAAKKSVKNVSREYACVVK